MNYKLFTWLFIFKFAHILARIYLYTVLGNIIALKLSAYII